jgi:hypothetical protein
LPTRDVDGRGDTPKEAVREMWKRIIPLLQEGYHAISSAEIVDTKTNEVVETFQLTDPEWAYVEQSTESSGTPRNEAGSKKRPKEESHRPPRTHEYAFKARVELQQ